jgi:hypothetical protein
MNLSSIKSVITSKAGRQVLTLQKHSPAILFGAGVVGVATTVVLACKATLKVEQEVLVPAQKNLGLIKDLVRDDYTEDDRAKDTALVYIQSAAKLTKLYGPAAIVGTVSIACLTGSHVVMSRRNAGLTAAYMALEKGFDKYRERVVEDLGEEKDREFRYGVEEVVSEDENGKKIVTRRAASDEPSIYAKLWDESSSSWNHNPDYNMMFLKAQQQYANDRLQTHGHLFLNEVYDSLGLDRTPEGQIVGWVKNNGDNYVDFGIFNDAMQPEHLAFFTGRENAIWLDFNVDGPVYQLI